MGSNFESDQVMSGIPIVDFANWNPSSTPAQRAEIASSLVDACRQVGFVYIINHGVSPTLLEEAFGWSERTF
jgi:isopenicillin N synthase-like dioxygenase